MDAKRYPYIQSWNIHFGIVSHIRDTSDYSTKMTQASEDINERYAHALEKNDATLYDELVEVEGPDFRRLPDGWMKYADCPLFERLLIDSEEAFSSFDDGIEHFCSKDSHMLVMRFATKVKWLQPHLIDGIHHSGRDAIELFDNFPFLTQFIFARVHEPHSTPYTHDERMRLGEAFARLIKLGYEPEKVDEGLVDYDHSLVRKFIKDSEETYE